MSLFNNSSNSLFSADSYLSSTAVTNAVIQFPISGIYAINWQVQFTNPSYDNSAWFAPLNCYGDTGSNNNGFRLASCDYSSSNYSGSFITFTGFFNVGDKIGLANFYLIECASTNSIYGSKSPILTVCLLH